MTLRCAVYTRKSSEEGLEQDFNSLHAQREACEAYITSQKHEGWQVIKTLYDDGGFSGGNIERPGLQMLLEDIEAGRVNIVVVYKVDRLTRSLADFAKIIERFEKHGVSFVSVTQQFNTTTPMGRLMLNVLLSFAQFEREVTGERIRDKISASKARGMWMGGNIPLGYKVEARKLVVVPEDADTVGQIFQRYLELGCVRLLQEDIVQQGIRSVKGHFLSRGSLYKMLSNPIYIGQIRHKEKCYTGQHKAIIDQALWEQVQARLSSNKNGEKTRSQKVQSGFLTGKLFDSAGKRLVQVQANKKGRRYRYYVSEGITNGPAKECPDAWRLPAQELENTVTQCVIRMMNDDGAISSVLHDAGISGQDIAIVLNAAIEHQKKLASEVHKHEALKELVERIELKPDQLHISLDLKSFFNSKSTSQPLTLKQDIMMQMKRRGIETKLIIEGNHTAKIDPMLVRTVAQAYTRAEELFSGKVPSMAAIASREGIDKGTLSRMMDLAFLAPNIVEAIAEGRQPPKLTTQWLLRNTQLPLAWKLQEVLTI
ncbi:MAG TPA: recombinase family protein [Rickettsiales bacterium]|nr:recombinase family protein [Rickettsiales bacterium]